MPNEHQDKIDAMTGVGTEWITAVPGNESGSQKNTCDLYDLAEASFDTLTPLNYFLSLPDGWLPTVMVDKALAQKELTIQRRIKETMRAYRDEHHLTQQEMADILGISVKNYSAYESRPDRWVPISLIVEFCDKTEISTQWMLRGMHLLPPRPRTVKTSSRLKG